MSEERTAVAKYISWAFFNFHLFVFIGVNAFLVITNYLTTPQTLWFIVPLSFWAVFLFTHFFVQFFLVSDSARAWRDAKREKIIPQISEKGLSETEMRRKASVRLFCWMAFYFHLYTYLSAGFILVLMNYLISSKLNWSLIVVFSWGIWVLIHFIITFILFDERLWEWREKKRKSFSASDKDNRLFFGFWLALRLHVILFVLANLLMFILDFSINKNSSAHWFYYPLISWGIIILAHWLLTFLVVSPKLKKWRK